MAFSDLQAITFLTNSFSHEIAMIRISQTGMNISSWLFHLAFKKQIIYR